MSLCFTLFVLLFTQLFLNLAHAAPNAGVNADQRKSQTSAAKTDDRRKRKPVKLLKKILSTESEHLGHPKAKTEVVKPRKAAAKTPSATTSSSAGKTKTAAVKGGKSTIPPSRQARETSRLTQSLASRKGAKKAYGRHRGGARAQTAAVEGQPLRMSESHKVRYQHAKLTAMAKLMSQVGKPYRWGGKSPTTGFDCSGLIYYAYKDLIRVPLPRTANEMCHLRDAAPVKKNELESGDLVFFRIRNRSAADHVGVYLGNGRFIQSPRTGRDIRISYLSEDYWQDHYVGARRVMTPTTIR